MKTNRPDMTLPTRSPITVLAKSLNDVGGSQPASYCLIATSAIVKPDNKFNK